MQNVLLIDRAPLVCPAVREIMDSFTPRPQLHWAEEGSACLRALDHSKFDLILVNHGVASDPDFTALENVRRQCPETPIILILEPGDEAHALRAISRGATEYVLRTEHVRVALAAAVQRNFRRMETNERLRIAKVQVDLAHRAQRLKQEFLSVLSHDLRTPLVGIRIYAQFLASGRLGALNAQQQEKIDSIARSAERLTRCIENIQRFERLECEELEVLPTYFDLKIMLGEIIAGVSRQCMEKGITLGHSFPHDSVIVHADRDLIFEAIRNLVENAVTFTGGKGSVSITVTYSGRENVSISVTDSGVGIPPERLAHLYESRWLCKSTGNAPPCKGMGLGMPIVKRILDAHNIRLDVDSRPESGTRFKFTLPLAAGIQAGRREPAQEEADNEQRHRVVLIVDDDDDNLACARSVLEYAGYEVLGANGFEEAKAQLNDGRVDVILLDIALNGESGLETLRLLRHYPSTSNIPVIMVSASTDDAARHEAAQLGAAAFVVKPFTPAKLLKEISVAAPGMQNVA